MIVNEALFDIEDQAEVLVQSILASPMVHTYQCSKMAMHESKEVQEKRAQFLKAKNEFEKIESYGSHAPDFKAKQRAVRQMKRQLDLCEEVANFRVSETEIQNILDTISGAVAKTISEDIKVDAGNPFFTKGKNHGCGGNCHAS